MQQPRIEVFIAYAWLRALHAEVKGFFARRFRFEGPAPSCIDENMHTIVLSLWSSKAIPAQGGLSVLAFQTSKSNPSEKYQPTKDRV